MAKYKHLTLTERVEIYSLLQQDKSIRSIAKALKRDPTTIAKEIKKHLEVKETGAGGRPFNQCEYSDNCTIRGVCGAKLCWKFCYKCTRCHLFCSKYKEHVCDRLLRSLIAATGALTREDAITGSFSTDLLMRMPHINALCPSVERVSIFRKRKQSKLKELLLSPYFKDNPYTMWFLLIKMSLPYAKKLSITI